MYGQGYCPALKVEPKDGLNLGGLYLTLVEVTQSSNYFGLL